MLARPARFLVGLLPLAAGIVLLVQGWSWTLLAMLAVVLLLSTIGNCLVRGSLLCLHCKQRELGCPAQKLFAREKRKASDTTD